MLAQKTAAPNLVILFGAGGIAPKLQRLPISVADSNTQTDALLHTGFEMLFIAALPEAPEPTDHELKIFREAVDPMGLVIGKSGQ